MNATLQGIVHGLSDTAYHALPSLSSTGLVKMLQAPAKFKHYRDNPEPPKKAYDLGTAVHAKVLGVGSSIAVIPVDVLSSNGSTGTNAARAWISNARAEGLIPMKQAEATEADALVEAVLSHPEARGLFEQPGKSEASVFADDPETGVAIRCRFDYLPDASDAWCVDLKTSAGDASEEGFSRTVAKPDLRYDVRQEFYLHTYGVATGEFAARMKFVVVEKAAPYLVGVHTLSEEYAEIGRMGMRKGIDTYAACLTAERANPNFAWPGYPAHATPIQPPMWLLFQEGAIE